MFGLDPLSHPVAIAEILLLLAFAALVGWLLGRLVLNGRIRTLRAAITDKQAEVDDCRRSKTPRSGATRSGLTPSAATVAPARDEAVPSTYTAPRSEPVIETPAAYVPADPLLPALSHDNTPVAVDSPVAVSVMTTEGPMTGNSEAVVLNRIAARANEINFDRIGRATAAEADDLKDIVGVGPFLERKLHSLGIYTFRQVANFTKEDVDQVNSIIEFFPGRIERDNWVDQSKDFHEKKYGRRN